LDFVYIVAPPTAPCRAVPSRATSRLPSPSVSIIILMTAQMGLSVFSAAAADAMFAERPTRSSSSGGALALAVTHWGWPAAVTPSRSAPRKVLSML